MLGAAAATALPRAARVAVLAAVTGLTAASEVVSFTRVIERTPPLRWLDMLGRRPATAGGAVGAAATSGEDGVDTPAGDADGEPDGRHQAGGPSAAAAAAPR
jgi:UDP-GlcNAc:undecaprenyl-phosphate/decaprenyl-phosphate GlcNAc-1-phosphate transferase